MSAVGRLDRRVAKSNAGRKEEKTRTKGEKWQKLSKDLRR